MTITNENTDPVTGKKSDTMYFQVDGEGMIFKNTVKLDVMSAAIELIVDYEDIMG
jgi:hypothetical protein